MPESVYKISAEKSSKHILDSLQELLICIKFDILESSAVEILVSKAVIVFPHRGLLYTERLVYNASWIIEFLFLLHHNVYTWVSSIWFTVMTLPRNNTFWGWDYKLVFQIVAYISSSRFYVAKLCLYKGWKKQGLSIWLSLDNPVSP